MNNTTKDLTLNTGSISKAILRAAGQTLKEECSQKYPNGIKYGQVAVTGGHGLKCRNIYHSALPFIHTSEHEDALQVKLYAFMVYTHLISNFSVNINIFTKQIPAA